MSEIPLSALGDPVTCVLRIHFTSSASCQDKTWMILNSGEWKVFYTVNPIDIDWHSTYCTELPWQNISHFNNLVNSELTTDFPFIKITTLSGKTEFLCTSSSGVFIEMCSSVVLIAFLLYFSPSSADWPCFTLYQ